MLKNMRAHTHNVQYRLITPSINTDMSDYPPNNYSNGGCGVGGSSLPPANSTAPTVPSLPSTSSNLNCASSSNDQRFFNELHDEFSLLRQQRSLAQISFKTCEPREEDRSRRAANRRQKRWRC